MLFLAPATATRARLISRRNYDRGRWLDYRGRGYRLLHDHRLRLYDHRLRLYDHRLLLHDDGLLLHDDGLLHDLNGLLYLDYLGKCRTSGNETCTYDHSVHILYSFNGGWRYFT